MKKKKRRRKNKTRFKPISSQQIIKINLGYFNEETNEDLRSNKYYLVTKVTKKTKPKNNPDLLLELLIITTHYQRRVGSQRQLISNCKIIDSPSCLPNTSFISRPRLILLKISTNKYRHHLCSECSRSCFSKEEFARITDDHNEYWKNKWNRPFTETIELEI